MESVPDGLLDIIPFFRDLKIPEPQDPKPLRLQKLSSLLVVRFLLITVVLSAIDFDHKESFEADEVDEVRAEGDLSAKLEVVKAPAAQSTPDESLDLGR
jgi:hypothetical protein